MRTNLCDLLPEEISDEGAYHLVNFFMSLASELDSYYFAQIRRYIKEEEMLEHPDIAQNKHNDESPF